MLMAVMMPREKWTDERLDDNFGRLDADIRELRGEIKDLRTEMNSRFDALNGKLIAGFFVLLAAVIGSNAAFYSLLA
jgi:hypothetical protein